MGIGHPFSRSDRVSFHKTVDNLNSTLDRYAIHGPPALFIANCTHK
jgi:hypothetical protein